MTLTKTQAHEYWKNPCETNNPAGYFNPIERSEYLARKIQLIEPSTDLSILELGSNVGRNLLYLKSIGYRWLFGVEINKDAVKLMSKKDKALANNIHIGSLEDVLSSFTPIFDLVFSMAVLIHIHPDSYNQVIDDMVRISRKYIAIVELVGNRTFNRAWERDYIQDFQNRGMHLVSMEKITNQADQHLSGYTFAMFRK